MKFYKKYLTKCSGELGRGVRGFRNLGILDLFWEKERGGRWNRWK